MSSPIAIMPIPTSPPPMSLRFSEGDRDEYRDGDDGICEYHNESTAIYVTQPVLYRNLLENELAPFHGETVTQKTSWWKCWICG